ncbi:MAG TPA: squalene/phytoene synthase family protein [Polyangiaceae bacterium]|nr:squalene/phytoene synthase family protein [Polyangiaceae bacterium]
MNDWQEHLAKTSRTFALSIPLLDEPLRREVTIAYLLFRVADTLEDAFVWPSTMRRSALLACGEIVRSGDYQQATRMARQWGESSPTTHAGYLALLAAFPSLLEDQRALRPKAARCIEHHLVRTIDQMADFATNWVEDEVLTLRTRDDLRAYCYAVAGIVGELLTELFILHSPSLRSAADSLSRLAPCFGEGLQLVNIAKDSVDDVKEGRSLIPSSMTTEDVIGLAHTDLDRADLYVQLLRRGGAPPGTIAFAALPVALARASLQKISKMGAGAKLTRAEVAELWGRVVALSTMPIDSLGFEAEMS